MNRSYRTIWNESLGAWVAVSEIQSAHGKPSSSSVAAGVVGAAAGVFAGRLSWMAFAVQIAIGAAVLIPLGNEAMAQYAPAASGANGSGASSTAIGGGVSSTAASTGSATNAVAIGSGSSARAT